MTPYQRERVTTARHRIGDCLSYLLDNKIIEAHQNAEMARDILEELLEKKK